MAGASRGQHLTAEKEDNALDKRIWRQLTSFQYFVICYCTFPLHISPQTQKYAHIHACVDTHAHAHTFVCMHIDKHTHPPPTHPIHPFQQPFPAALWPARTSTGPSVTGEGESGLGASQPVHITVGSRPVSDWISTGLMLGQKEMLPALWPSWTSHIFHVDWQSPGWRGSALSCQQQENPG